MKNSLFYGSILICWFSVTLLGCINQEEGEIVPSTIELTVSIFPSRTPEAIPTVEPISDLNTYWLDTLTVLGDGHILDVAVSPNKSSLAVYTGARIDIYDQATFSKINSLSIDKSNANDLIRFMPDGDHIIFSQGSSLSLWHFKLGQEAERLPSNVRMSNYQIDEIEFTADKGYMIVTTSGSGTAGAWVPLSSSICEGRTINFAIFEIETFKKTYDQYSCLLAVPDVRMRADGLVQIFSGSWMVERHPYYPMQTTVIDPKTGDVVATAQQIYKEGEMLNLDKVVTTGNLNVLPTDEEIISWFEQRHAYQRPDEFLKDCGIDVYVGEGYQLIVTDQHISTLLHQTQFGHQQVGQLERWDNTDCIIQDTISYSAADLAKFSPDGSSLAYSDGISLHVWDVEHKKLNYSIKINRFNTPISQIHFNSDGSKLLTRSSTYTNFSTPGLPNEPQPIMIRDTRTGEDLGILPAGDNSIVEILPTYHPDIILSIDSARNTTIWNIETETSLNPGDAPLPSLFAIDEKREGVWFSYQQEGQGTYQLFLVDLETGVVVREMAGRNGELQNVIVSANGGEMYLFEPHGLVKVIDITTEQIIGEFENPLGQFNYQTEDGQYYDLDHGDSTHFFDETLSFEKQLFGELKAVSRELVITQYRDTFFIWHRETRGFVHRFSADEVVNILISPDSRYIAQVKTNGRVKILGINREKW